MGGYVLISECKVLLRRSVLKKADYAILLRCIVWVFVTEVVGEWFVGLFGEAILLAIFMWK